MNVYDELTITNLRNELELKPELVPKLEPEIESKLHSTRTSK